MIMRNLIILIAVSLAVDVYSADNETKLNRDILSRSLKLGRQFFLNNQLKSGNFRYEYDCRNGSAGDDDNSVRQAGALWGASLVHSEIPDDESLKLVRRGMAFFMKRSRSLDSGGKLILYPGERVGKTGTVALVSLALIELLRSKPDMDKKETERCKRYLAAYVKFLMSIRGRNGLFFSTYKRNGKGMDSASPYSDGEVLLMLTRVAKYLGHGDLRMRIMNSAESMYQKHVVNALKNDPDSAQTKGFYQWGSMAFYEIYTSGWGDGTRKFGKRIVHMADWMIHTHKILKRTRNTAYAYEGLIHAHEVARREKNAKAMKVLASAIDKGLYKISTWQIGSPIANAYICEQERMQKRAKGGVLNHASEPMLRIDVTQHQMHAVILARKYVYKAK